jgi:cysteine synthase A
MNVAGAMRLAKDMGPGHTIVTILCDFGTRYQSKLYNPAFLREKGLPIPDWLDEEPASLPDVTEVV